MQLSTRGGCKHKLAKLQAPEDRQTSRVGSIGQYLLAGNLLDGEYGETGIDEEERCSRPWARGQLKKSMGDDQVPRQRDKRC